MKRNYSLSISLLLLASLVSISVAQTVTDPVLLSRPELVRPKGKNGYLPSGEIRAWVIVDVDGNVSRIASVDGPGWVCPSVPGVAEIHKAAREAAIKAKFIPASREGTGFESGAMIVFDDYVSLPTPAYVAGNQEQFNATQDPSSGTPNRPLRPISGGVLNGKAKSLAAPKYPAAAKAVRASGSVAVQVLIGEAGNILSAEPISGHPLLRSASRFAACESEFSPTLLQGQPVKVSGIITYNFAL
ncbi:MAG TPA: energy transducer TonB [Pyrinomonadaceae bacterium]|nr:energy transducer TonB [Pyrinomonadaceae bacterium]